jgi:hypothetical protein
MASTSTGCHGGRFGNGAARPQGDHTGMRPILVVNPRTDREFVDLANRLVEDGIDNPEELESSLRRRFPLAVVRQRVLSAESMRTWYVYREGKWIASRTT